MSKEKEEILMKLAALGTQPPVIMPAKVLSVDESELTCQVEIEELEFSCRLNAAESSVPGFIAIPDIDSWILAGRIDPEGNVWAMITCTAISKVLFTIEDMTFEMSADGYKMNSSISGLRKTLDDLLDAVMQLTVTTPAGPSGVPINLAAFQSIKTELDNYLQ